MYKQSTTRKPIVFLDDESAGACAYFLEEGVPKRDIHPVNGGLLNSDAITQASGIECKHSDINDHITSLPDDSHSVVWLDYTCTTIKVEVLRDALRVAPNVSVTLSLRGMERIDNEKHVRKIVKKVGTLASVTYYKGKGEVENMMSFIVNRAKTDNIPCHDDRRSLAFDTVADGKSGFEVNDSVIIAWRGNTSLTAVVLETSDDNVQVVFDCDGAVKWVPLCKVTSNRVTHADKKLDALVGKTLLVPSKLWPTKKEITGYADVKTVGKKLAFMIVKRYRKSNRYTLVGISKRNDRPLHTKENWTLTYDQACCYVKM